MRRADMGGWGSTHWRGHDKKPLVEESLVLDIRALARHVRLSAGVHASGEITWGWPLEPTPHARYGFELDTIDPVEGWFLRLRAIGGGPERPMPLGIDLVPTPQSFGGVRWWFGCPEGYGR
jgi:hypothetical protein